ncbi:MAG: S41 family peptidase [Actinomycetota bacterium]|nr:S41 family peptidase [Actinomycetota bacterium]
MVLKNMRKINILKIIGAAVGIILIFAAGFWLGLDFTNRFNLKAPLISQLLFENSENKNDASSSGGTNTDDLNIKSLGKAIDSVSKEAFSPKTKEELVVVAIKAVLDSLNDRHSEYFTKEQYAKIMESYQGIMSGGIGIIVTTNDNKETEVVKVIKGSPSSKMDIRQGDVIKKVNGEDVSNLAIEEVVSKIKGPVDTEVTITFFRLSENKSFDLKIKRGTFTIPNFVIEMIEGNIAYAQYYEFQEGGAQQLEEELDEMIKMGAKAVVLDLRNNLGGVLNDAVYLCDLFLDKGVIVTVKGRTDNKDSFEEFEASEGKYIDIPLVVLINEYSASASELSAGALKDNKRAMLIGEKSYGKGTVQVLHILPDGSGIKFTTAKYYLPSGISIDGTGIKPDISVKLDAQSTSDLQKEKAIEEIKKLIK